MDLKPFVWYTRDNETNWTYGYTLFYFTSVSFKSNGYFNGGVFRLIRSNDKGRCISEIYLDSDFLKIDEVDDSFLEYYMNDYELRYTEKCLIACLFDDQNFHQFKWV